jgi:hypothetical protein
MTDPLSRVIDSIAFVAAVRTAFLIVEDKANPNRRLFLPLKSNISSTSAGLAFQIEPHVLPSGIETSRVSWHKRPVTITAAEALTALTPDDDIDDAKEVAEQCLSIMEKASVPKMRSSSLSQLLGVSQKQLKKLLGLLGIHIHRQSDANYYAKADLETLSHPHPPSSTPP